MFILKEKYLTVKAKLNKTLAVLSLAAMFVAGMAVVIPQTAVAQTADSTGDRKIKQKVSPQYPDIARHAIISGVVKLEAVIAPSGSVKSVKVIGGHPLLANAAEDALKRWKYEPSSSESTEVVEFRFNPGM